MYFPHGDLLLRASEPIKYLCNNDWDDNGLPGCYLLFLLMRHYTTISAERLVEAKEILKLNMLVDGKKWL